MTNWRRIEECARVVGGALLLALSLVGCASHSAVSRHLAPLHDHEIPPVDVPDFAEVTPQMEAFLQRWVAGERGRDTRAWTLAWAVTDRNVLDFHYDPAVTLAPAETFARRTGNCLSFALMLVAMARHVGLDAWYQEVEVPPQWNNANNTLLVSLHINVVVQGNQAAWVVDVSGETGTRTRRLRRVDDAEARAQYLNNLGAEALTNDDLGTAYAYFLSAITAAPELSYLWSNLGVVYNRNGQTGDAQRAHRAALRIDPGNAVAANNLFLIYEQQGDRQAARALQARVEKHRRRNPYYLYHLSLEAFDAGRVAEARALLERAIALNGREYRFHYELARTLLRSGDRAAARTSLQRALELAPGDALAGDVALDNLPQLPE